MEFLDRALNPCVPMCLPWRVQMPFGLMATQYRRKRYMEGLMTGAR